MREGSEESATVHALETTDVSSLVILNRENVKIITFS